MDRVRDLVLAGNSAQLVDPEFIRELKAWLRFSPREAALAGDGLFSAASGSQTLPASLGPTLFDWVFTAEAENEKYARQLRLSAGIAVFVSEKDDREHWVLAGSGLPAVCFAGDRAWHETRVHQSARRSSKTAPGTGELGWFARPSPRYCHALRLWPVTSLLGPSTGEHGAGVTPPFTIEQFLGIFVAYNTAIWPVQIVAYVLGILAVTVVCCRL